MMQQTSFINNTDLPIMIEYLKRFREDSGCYTTYEKLALKGIEIELNCELGEWFIHNMYNKSEFPEHIKSWNTYATENNIQYVYGYLGKFRNKPCISGDYSWMETYNFIVTHSFVFENGIEKIIFSFEYNCKSPDSLH